MEALQPPASIDGEDDERALFRPVERAGGAIRLQPTDFCRSPWDQGILHGGPVGGLVALGAEQLIEPDARLQCARLTVEMLSAVPGDELTVSAAVVKPGTRTRMVDVTVAAGERVVARGATLWLRPGPLWSPNAEPAPPRPSEAANPWDTAEIEYPRPGFNCDAAELRYTRGSNEEPGPSVVWARLTSPLVAGEATSPLARAATVADLAAAAGWDRAPDGPSYINPDLTIQLGRYPAGPWICLDAGYRRSSTGLAFNQASLFDDDGAFGLVLQSLVESPIVMP